MKLILSIVLCLALVHGAFAGETNAPPTAPTGNMTLCELMLVIGCVAAGGAIVIWCYSKNGKCCAKHKLVLYRDNSDGNWLPIATNVVSVCTNKIDVFADIINKGDVTVRYKVQDQGIEQ